MSDTSKPIVEAPKLFIDLLSAAGPSGHETEPARVWREGCAFADEVGSDAVGSSFARVDGTESGRSLIVVGHIDEIGIHITHVEDGGFLRFGDVGGWDPLVLVGQRVRIATRRGPVLGVIARGFVEIGRGLVEIGRAPDAVVCLEPPAVVGLPVPCVPVPSRSRPPCVCGR